MAAPQQKLEAKINCSSCSMNKSIIENMLQNEAKLIEKMNAMEERLNKYREDNDKLKEENNYYRTIGMSDNPEVDGDGNIDVWIASHKITWESLSDETIIRRLRANQKMLEFWMLTIQTKKNKIQITKDIIEKREVVVKEASQKKEKEQVDSNEVTFKKHFPSEYKVIRGMMKSMNCTELVAIESFVKMTKRDINDNLIVYLKPETRKALRDKKEENKGGNN
jgi:hypothetical protein